MQRPDNLGRGCFPGTTLGCTNRDAQTEREALGKHSPRSAHHQNADPAVKVPEGARPMDPRGRAPKHISQIRVPVVHRPLAKGLWYQRGLEKLNRVVRKEEESRHFLPTQLAHCHWKQRPFSQSLALVLKV